MMASEQPPAVNSAYAEVNGIPYYGLDAENILKLEYQDDLIESLRSGIVLCKLLNSARADTITKMNTRAVPLLQRENLGLYLEACARVWRLPQAQLFAVSDLYERKDVQQVLRHLWAVTRRLQPLLGAHVPELRPPTAALLPLVDAPSAAQGQQAPAAAAPAQGAGRHQLARSQSVPAQRARPRDAVERLLSDVAADLQLDVADSRLAAARRSLTANAYDSPAGLRELREADLLRLQPPVPHRVARAIARRLAGVAPHAPGSRTRCCSSGWWRLLCCACWPGACCDRRPAHQLDLEQGMPDPNADADADDKHHLL